MDKNRYFQIRSRKYTKTKVADIQRLYSKWLWLVMAVYKPSLSDAKSIIDRLQEKYDEIFQDGNEVAQMSIRFAD